MRHECISIGLAAIVAVSAACANTSGFSDIQSYGPNPTLPEPDTSLIPTVNVVKAIGWGEGEQPTPAAGRRRQRVCPRPRCLRGCMCYPTATVRAETNAPPRPDDGKGIMGWFFRRYQKKAGGVVPSANRITLCAMPMAMHCR